MTKRKLTLRDYQIKAKQFAIDNKIAVLGVAPNGGKTEIAISYIEYLVANKKDDLPILVLTHSTNVLKDNFVDRLNEINVSFTYSTTFGDAQVHIALPQQINHIKGKYNTIIVDEAHENYFAKTVQRIIKTTKPKRQLLLTGTPAPFVANKNFNDKIYILSINDMITISPKYFSKLSFELVSSSYDWDNNLCKDEVRMTYVPTIKQSNTTLDSVVSVLNKRVKGRNYNDTFTKAGKTIIACRTIKQSDDIFKILVKNDVDCAISHSQNDTDSQVVSDFKNDCYNVLVVVGRARLGYSDVNLINYIDMTGTMNPCLINQMFCRVLWKIHAN